MKSRYLQGSMKRNSNSEVRPAHSHRFSGRARAMLEA
jgi:hypothetical protein